MKKIISMILIFVFMLNINIATFADDLDEENINEEEVIEDILKVSTDAEKLPQINSRAVLIFDRASKRVLYEKNGYTR